MNKLYLFIFFLAFTFPQNIVNAQTQPEWPTFTMTATNIQSYPSGPPGPNQQDSIITFEVYLQQTNQGQPGVHDLEFCCAQYNWYFDEDIFRNPSVGNLVLTNLGNQTDLPVALRPPTFQVDSTTVWPNVGSDRRLLKTSGNLPNSNINFFISGSYPGTKILKMKLTTNGRKFNELYYHIIRWKLGGAPNTFLAYFVPNPPGPDSARPQFAQSLLDTNVNQYVPVYYYDPVEMASFVSTVVKNNVELNWSTATETNNQMFEIERAVANSTSTEWTKVGTVPGNGTTTEIRNFNFTDRRVSTGHYIYRLKQIDFNGTVNYHDLSDEVIVGVPTAYALSQNYPNPFNPTTKIDYELPYDGKVSILLYDISGREVATLVNEVKTAGYYTIQFSASGGVVNLSSGMYFYRIIASGSEVKDFVATKKMLLIK
ncbi:MAG TPA: T9SS type A sorting domain-containing protein [Ignavibacteria bacterium]|nr:T9SS type A sorting domain-containing protein [Ignavibacteria bacterium]HMR39028.1 T9SS type A sorting domain-containing protein [Ignavibacteria bacterium]